jgi:hypothetical protein
MQPSARLLSAPKRLSKCFRLLVGIPLSLLLICGGGYYWLDRPQYIVEDILPPDRHPWFTTETIVQKWEDSGHRFFIWRRETEVFGCCDAKNEYYTWQSIAAYFDEQLGARGWQPTTHDTCRGYLAESSFLKNGTDGYLVYGHPGSDPFDFEPIVCVAIWQEPSVKMTDYHVVFVTAQPSFFTDLANALD